MIQKPRIKQEPIGLTVVPAYCCDLCDVAVSSNSPDMHDEMDRKSNGFANAPVRQSNVRCQYAMGKAREGLFCGVRVNRAETAEVSGVQSLQQVERFGAAHLANEDAIRPMPKGRTKQVRDGDGRQRCLLAERWLCTPRFQSNHVRLAQVNLCGLLNQDDAIVIGNVRG
jgi:hypothetical protein